MTEKDYVTEDVAKTLREKGFNEKCRGYFYNGVFCFSCFHNEYNKTTSTDSLVSAPSLAQAARWLREEHNIHVDVGLAEDFLNDADGNVCEERIFWAFDIYTIDSLHHFDVEDNREYDSYEEALNEGIKEVLKII